jgi:hypothetical protein
VNFGSSSVTIFAPRGNTMSPIKTIRTASQPVSAAFGHGHLVVLGLTTAESFRVYGEDVGNAADGAAPLLRSDKSAAQIVAFNGGVVYSEKSGSVAQLELGAAIGGGLSGPNRTIALPATPNNDTPFGMIARGDNVYLTIAQPDLRSSALSRAVLLPTGWRAGEGVEWNLGSLYRHSPVAQERLGADHP